MDTLDDLDEQLRSIGAGFGRVHLGITHNPHLSADERSSLIDLTIQPFYAFEELTNQISIEEDLIPNSPDFPLMMASLETTVSSAGQKILTAEKPEVLDALLSIIWCLGDVFAQWQAAASPNSRERRERDFKRELIQSANLALGRLKEQESFRKLHREVVQIAEDAQEAAGITANSEVASFYQERAQQERLRYVLWNSLLIAASSAAAIVGWFAVNRTADATLTIHEFARITVALPIFAFAVYAARQASYHRNAEAEANLTAVQLKTVKAFTDALDATSKQEMLRLLGSRIFGAAPPLSSTEATDKDYDNPSTEHGLPALLEELKKLIPSQKANNSPQ
ncbi:hypothetical protein [Verrucosispora sioxanthis]|uniref:Uncharacterized protein n=1 Tax=Verrucosispora sioxanthis TaxID=2499994 RepID=A0A6M1KWH5_9ACTN|nr:hypothetical protein [Verrucosispora sioxanthis]NEE64415.1 hypothetical protein [Verrucosispora sioxanthis]NGM13525.1 hypothetical protein [Verrucosispora sioxanthis]